MQPFHWHLRLTLAALCLMLTLPFINAHHFQPIPTFYQEWTAAVLGLLATALLLRKEVIAQLEIPHLALLPIGLLALILIQYANGQIVFVTQALLFTLYLLWAMALLILGRALRRELGLDRLITPLAFALLIGSVLSALLHCLQLGATPLGLRHLFQKWGGGNLAQANHLANYLWLGLTSAIYLHARARLRTGAFIVLALLLLSSASLSGSRSILFYAVSSTALSGWASWRQSENTLKPIFKTTLLVLASTVLLQFLLSHFNSGGTLGTTVSGERFIQEVNGSSQRLQLWRTGLAIFADHAWLGVGIGQFPWRAYALMGSQDHGGYLGGAEHSHNFFIHLLVEFGIAAPLLALILGTFWWLGFLRERWTPAHWWIAAVLLVLGLHSQLEYPLWYTFFLGIAALTLGAGSTASFRPQTTASSRPIVAAMLLLGGVTLGNLKNDYRELEQALNWRLLPADSQPSEQLRLETLSRLQRESLFAHYVDLIVAHQLEFSRDYLQEKIAISRRAVRFSPANGIAFNLAYLLALDGQTQEALLELRRALATYPSQQTSVVKRLEELAPQYPELRLLLSEILKPE